MNNSIYLNIEEIFGECKDADQIGSIDVHSFQWKMSQPAETGQGGGCGGGRGKAHPLVVYVRMDRAMPTVVQKLLEGTHLKNVKLTMCRAGGEQQPFTIVTLEEAFLESVEFIDLDPIFPYLKQNLKPDSNITTPSPFMGMKYSFSPIKFKVVYNEQNNDGNNGASVEASWNVQTNRSE
ncbi:Hcp family type VI secretion system effector [Photorhabdus heterorhabditis]|uniref:Hcp family type VI secretion system effector n=1 Tax=Photorhabdus heterorhabditis TaxID=880156 RepID=UPI001BD226DB|nr:type VI secretion system tube protein Hcp [Photorhabdus heterorhabditis]